MFKKILVLLACLFITSQALASQVIKTLVDGVTLSDVVTSASGADYLGDADRVAFFVTYNETDATAALSMVVTCQISYDNITYQAASFYDYAGGSTLATESAAIDTDGSYYFWFNRDLTVPYVKVILTPTGHDSTHTALVSVYSVKQQ